MGRGRFHIIGLCVAALVVTLPRGAGAEEVRVTLRDGREICGTLVGFIDGHYVVRVGDQEQRIPESEIRNCRSSVPAGSLPDSGEPGTLSLVATSSSRPEAKAAFDAALSAERAGTLNEAIDGYLKAASLDPWFVGARLAAANVFLKAGRPLEAVDLCEGILKVDPTDLRALELLVRSCEAGGRPERAMMARQSLLERKHSPAEAAYRTMQLWREAGDWVRARAAWERYRKLDPDLAAPFAAEGLLWRQAEEAFAARDYETAIARFYEVQKTNPFLRQTVLDRQVAAHLGRAEIAQTAGDLDEELRQYRLLATLVPSRSDEWNGHLREVHIRYGEHAWRGRQPDEFTRAIEEARRDLSSEICRGLLANAVHGCVKAVDEAPRDAGWSGMIAVLLKAVRSERVVDPVLETALIVSWVHQGDAAIVAKDSEGAIAAYEQALAADADLHEPLGAKLSEAWQLLGQASFVKNDLPGAIAAWNRALEYRPGDPGTVAQLHTARFQQLEEHLAVTDDFADRSGFIDVFLNTKPPADLARKARELLGVKEEEAAAAPVALQQPPTGCAYWPLQPGSWWRYRRGNGNEEVVLVKSADPIGDGELRILCEKTGSGGGGQAVSYSLLLRKNELLSGLASSREVLFQLPVREGTAWEWSDETFRYRRTYAALHEQVCTAAGVFHDCLKLEFRTTTVSETEAPIEMISTLYYAPGVGLVQMTVSGEGNQDLGLELVGYEVLPPPAGTKPPESRQE